MFIGERLGRSHASERQLTAFRAVCSGVFVDAYSNTVVTTVSTRTLPDNSTWFNSGEEESFEILQHGNSAGSYCCAVCQSTLIVPFNCTSSSFLKLGKTFSTGFTNSPPPRSSRPASPSYHRCHHPHRHCYMYYLNEHLWNCRCRKGHELQSST